MSNWFDSVFGDVPDEVGNIPEGDIPIIKEYFIHNHTWNLFQKSLTASVAIGVVVGAGVSIVKFLGGIGSK